MFARRLSGATRHPAPNAARLVGLLLGASGAALAPLSAFAQDAPGSLLSPPASQLLEAGLSIRAQVDVVFQPSGADPVRVMRTSFEAGAMGANANSDYVFEILNNAALAGLNQALGQGAKSGRVTVMAVGCQVGVDTGSAVRAWAPVGVFINTTDMDVGANGVANFHTRVQFIPDAMAAAQPVDPSPFRPIPPGQ